MMVKKSSLGLGACLILSILFSDSAPVHAGETLYYLGDPLGSTDLIINSSAEVVGKVEYAPFGEGISEYPLEEGIGLNSLFTGQEIDRSSDLYYYGARCYDPILSRFMSIDPVRDETNPQDLNLYAYAWNNPLQVTDPSGTEEKKDSKEGPVVLLRFNLYNYQLGEDHQLSKEEGHSVVHFLRAVSNRYGLRYSTAGRKIGSEEVDAALKELSPTTDRFIEEDLMPFHSYRYENSLELFFGQLVVFKDRFRRNRVRDQCAQVCLGMSKEQVFKIMEEPPIRVSVYTDFDSGKLEVGFDYIEDPLVSDPTSFTFDLETGQVNSICCG